MRFRPDIEGLRAIAILLVVAAHAGVPWLAGGYIGVDVFFILSGYLITRLLTDELLRTHRIQFARFYARRFRRLLPALLLMLAVTALLGSQLVAASQQGDQASAGAAAALWASNLLFAFTRLDYFGADSSTNLYLHTWSLGVEEQFYLVWPLLLVVGYCAWRKTVPPSRRNIIQGLWLVVAVSFASCVVITSVEPRHAFYLMPMRAWQFALGGLAGLYFADRDGDAGSASPQLALLGWFGLAGILASAVLLGDNVRYPGAWALLPTLGTLAVLIAGANAPCTMPVRFLSLPAMTAVGRISYSWYLWHWPIFVFGALLWPTASPPIRIVLVLVSLLLAWLSWRYIETPIRESPGLIQPPRRGILVALLLMTCTVAGSFQWQAMARQTLAAPAYQRIQRARNDLSVIYRQNCDQWYRSASLTPCEFGNPQASNTLVVLGDSIGLQWFPAIERVFAPENWRIVVMTKSACPIVDEPIFYARIGREYTECAQWRQDALQQIAELRPNFLVLGSTFTYDFTPTQWEAGTARILQSLTDSVGHIAILRSTPALSFDGPSCTEPRSSLYTFMIGNSTRCAAPSTSERDDSVYQSLQAAANGFTNVRIVNMNDVICPDGLCYAEHDGMITFRDSQHLSSTYAASLANELRKRLDVPK